MKHLSTHPRPWHGRRLLALLLALATLVSLGLLVVAPSMAPAQTIVSIEFDDGISDQYQALPLLAVTACTPPSTSTRARSDRAATT